MAAQSPTTTRSAHSLTLRRGRRRRSDRRALGVPSVAARPPVRFQFSAVIDRASATTARARARYPHNWRPIRRLPAPRPGLISLFCCHVAAVAVVTVCLKTLADYGDNFFARVDRRRTRKSVRRRRDAQQAARTEPVDHPPR